MLLYALNTKPCRTWILDLDPPPPGESDRGLPSV